jgi:hypothetical protein
MSAVAATAASSIDISTEFRPYRPRDVGAIQIPNSTSAARVPSSHVPRPDATPVVAGTGANTGFDGVNFFDQRFLADGGNQFSLEPPDPMTCVGNGFVISDVNTALRIHNTAGNAVSGLLSLNRLYYDESAFVRSPVLTYGSWSVFDPKCFYDHELDRFVLVAAALGQNTTGALDGRAEEVIAVSETSTPTANRDDWFIYRINVRNDGTGGTPSHPGCPCFGDQPLIGFDDNGFYITTNEFSISPFGAVFN